MTEAAGTNIPSVASEPPPELSSDSSDSSTGSDNSTSADDLSPQLVICPCGTSMPRVPSTFVTCQGCQNKVCMYRECKKVCETEWVIRKHVKEAHANDPSPINEIKYCVCGVRKVKVAGIDIGSCRKCQRSWCNIGNCPMSKAQKRGLRRHQKICAYRNDINPDQCSNCGQSKNRDGVATRSTCPNCHRFWCLFKNCTYETDNENYLVQHHIRGHREMRGQMN